MPFILIGLIILLVAIVISVIAYPLICACFAIVCRRFNKIVTGIIMLLTIVLYFYACTTFEESLDDWCYSLYIGLVITPLTIFICTGLESPSEWGETGETPKHSNITIPILTFFTSLFFAIEGILRMADSYSIHTLLNNAFISTEAENYLYYYDVFQYAGGILFFISVISALIIGFMSFDNLKDLRQKIAIERENRLRIDNEVKVINKRLKEDTVFFDSLDSQQYDKVILYYHSFCNNIITALESSDENSDWSFEYNSLNGIETSIKTLLLSSKKNKGAYYLYLTGIVEKDSNDSYKYIPYSRTTVSIASEQKNKRNPLPNDVKPIYHTWLHSCRDGSVDLRYSYNPKIYVYKYSHLCINELSLYVYRTNVAKEVLNSYKELLSCISQFKEKIPHEKTIEEELTPNASHIICKDEQLSPQTKSSETTKYAQPQVISKNPKTLEECFSDIILKKGTDALADTNIVNVISSSYKDVDIKEYKDILSRMANDKFLCQFVELNKQNDFTLYNITSSYARLNKLNVSTSLFIIQALVKAIKNKQ